jgi:dihydroorotate dehydrogenase electron transfer subunit
MPILWDNIGMKEEACIVVENRHINKKYYLLKIKAPYVSEKAKPGNFVMLKASPGIAPLLKRPFGVFNTKYPFTWLYYEVVGRGTAAIANLRPDDPVQMLGPLGNRFPAQIGKNILLVAGGRGIAPIHYAISEYAAANNVYLIYGARSAGDLNLVEELKELGLKKMFLYTDDGSAYQKGFVTTDIRRIITDHHIDVTVSCGPDAMFESLAHEIGGIGTENWVSLEALMGCGFGICYSCAVKTAAGEYKKVCSDGPVFRMEEIAWQKQ